MRRRRGGLERDVVAVLVADGGALTPGQVRDALGAGRAYTPVMTVLARLDAKGVVVRERAARGFAYRAVVDEDEIAARRIRLLLDARDDRAAALSRFVDALSPEDERLLVDLLRPAGDPAGPDAPAPAPPDAGR